MAKYRPLRRRKHDPITQELDQLYGPFAARHHARYHDPSVPYHIVIRALQGFALFTPTQQLNDLIAGVIGRAQTIFTSVRIYGFAFLSNHAHLMLQGLPNEMPAFIGYLKKEVTRRLAGDINWRDSMWSAGYISTALPTPASHERCLEYILSQGCKEHLVDRPEHWPGLHIAKQLLTSEPLIGKWLDGTRYGKACWKERQKPEVKRRKLSKRKYTRTYDVELTPIPLWAEFSPSERHRKVAVMVTKIAERARIARNGRPSLGAERILKVPRTQRWPLPKPPWFQERRRMITWAAPRAPETLRYQNEYWAFQQAYRAASDDYLAGNANAEFPEGSFRPPIYASRLRPPDRRLAAA